MSADNLEKIHAFLKKANEIAWGPPLLFLLLGTGIFLMIQLRALPVRRLVFALRTAFGRRARRTGEPTEAGVSPFASLMTELAAKIRDRQYRGRCLGDGTWRSGSTGVDDAGSGDRACTEIFGELSFCEVPDAKERRDLLRWSDGNADESLSGGKTGKGAGCIFFRECRSSIARNGKYQRRRTRLRWRCRIPLAWKEKKAHWY